MGLNNNGKKITLQYIGVFLLKSFDYFNSSQFFLIQNKKWGYKLY